MRRWLCNRLIHTPEYNQTRSATAAASAVNKDKICPKSSSSTGVTSAPSPPVVHSSSTTLKTTKKRSLKKRSNSKVNAHLACLAIIRLTANLKYVPQVLVELHPHRASVAGSSSNRGSETRVPILSPAVITKNTSAPTRRTSLPNRLNCYVVPPSATRTPKDSVRRDPPAR